MPKPSKSRKESPRARTAKGTPTSKPAKKARRGAASKGAASKKVNGGGQAVQDVDDPFAGADTFYPPCLDCSNRRASDEGRYPSGLGRPARSPAGQSSRPIPSIRMRRGCRSDDLIRPGAVPTGGKRDQDDHQWDWAERKRGEARSLSDQAHRQSTKTATSASGRQHRLGY